MAEPIRLIVWDLDETFWHGTLTEGGISYIHAHHEIVIELARRGIMSSICSKNDFEPIKKVLEEFGLWEYFIFPSIDWTPKAPRLATLVEAVQLRPATILFIDDNPMNRNEATHFLPDLQVAAETIIPSLLDSPLCQGKDDQALSRLAQYKLLETKQNDQNASGDTTEFLRASGIQVTIEHHIDPHFDRVVELINRTNQLNFTKHRLPEEPAAAHRALRDQLGGFMKHAGLIHVKDRYGDYGYVGFYLIRSFADSKELEHFCFSCRTLGMGVETWLYERLGKPKLQVKGEVLTDLFTKSSVDWINQGDLASSRDGEKLASRILVRGGCNMTSAAHYLELNAAEVVGEFNIIRDTLSVRTDLSRFLRYALDGMSAPALQAAVDLGYTPSDFKSALADDPGSFDVCVFSFQIEMQSAEYRHPASGLQIPFFRLYEPNDNRDDVLLSTRQHSPQNTAALARLRSAKFEYVGAKAIGFSENLRAILAYIPQKTIVFFVLAPEVAQSGKDLIDYYVTCNQVVQDSAGSRPNTHFLNILDFVEHSSDRLDAHHFARMVYFRLYQRIAQILRDPSSARQNNVKRQVPASLQQPGASREVDRTELEYIVSGIYQSLLRRAPDPYYLNKHCDVIDDIGLDDGIAYLVKHFRTTGEFGRVLRERFDVL